MKLLSVTGTRPNFTKMAPVFDEIKKRDIEHIFVHTGQHYDRNMSEVFLEELEMPTLDYYLNIGSGGHGEQTGRMLMELEKVMEKEVPDIVLVPGDTNTTIAGAMAAVKLNIPVAHIEAGLRSFDRTMPEEINRIMTDHISDYHFCPSDVAVKNLVKEGITGDNVVVTGDTMVDNARRSLRIGKNRYPNILEKYGIPGDYALATIHRAGNTDSKENLSGIVEAFLESGLDIVLTLHPRTRKMLGVFGLLGELENNERIHLLEPIGNIEFMVLLESARLMLTDSGGVQKEALFMRTPCVTMRDNTEWVETLELGVNILVGSRKRIILEGITKMWNAGAGLNFSVHPYGDGNASKKMIDALE